MIYIKNNINYVFGQHMNQSAQPGYATKVHAKKNYDVTTTPIQHPKGPSNALLVAVTMYPRYPHHPHPNINFDTTGHECDIVTKTFVEYQCNTSSNPPELHVVNTAKTPNWSKLNWTHTIDGVKMCQTQMPIQQQFHDIHHSMSRHPCQFR